MIALSPEARGGENPHENHTRQVFRKSVNTKRYHAENGAGNGFTWQKQKAHPRRAFAAKTGIWRVTARSLLTPKVLGVALLEVLPLFRQVVHCEDGRDRADWDAGAAVDALDRVNIDHFLFAECGLVFLGVNAIDRACIHAGGVLGSNAGFCDYIGHDSLRFLFFLVSFQN
jgi:hypothetical protein